MKKIFILLLAIVFMLSGCSLLNPFAGAEIGDVITFGSYEQDNDSSNGKEPIEWLVLAKEDERILVTSVYGLDCQPYNTEKEDVTWETCTLRGWLNTTFLDEAFSDTEQRLITKTTVTADNNPSYDTDTGNDTQDKVFLLSIKEANKYFSSDTARQVKATPYAEHNGAYVEYKYVEAEGNSSWWLRSPGNDGNRVIDVALSGKINYYGYTVDDDFLAVRPALWISIK